MYARELSKSLQLTRVSPVLQRRIRIINQERGKGEYQCTHPLQWSLELVGIHERYRHHEHAAYGSEV